MKPNLLVKTLIIPSAITLLIGCNDKLVRESNNQFNEQQEKSKEIADQQAKVEKERNELYESMEGTPEDAVKHNAESLVELEVKEKIPEQKNFTDPIKFSQFVSQRIFSFTNSFIEPVEHLSFLKKFGSETFKEQYLSGDDEKDLTYLTYVQDLFKQQGFKGESFIITYINYPNNTDDYGYFYRKETFSNNHTAYYKTVILKDKNGYWKVEDDGPAPDYEVQDLENKENEQVPPTSKEDQEHTNEEGEIANESNEN